MQQNNMEHGATQDNNSSELAITNNQNTKRKRDIQQDNVRQGPIQDKSSSELAVQRSKNTERQRNYRKRLSEKSDNAEQQSNSMAISSTPGDNLQTADVNRPSEQQTYPTVQMQQLNLQQDVIQDKLSSELAIQRSKNAERQRNYRKRLAQAKCNAEQQSNLMKIASGTIENKSTEQQTDSTVQMQQENTKKDAIQDNVPSEIAIQRRQNAKRQRNYRTRLSEEMLDVQMQQHNMEQHVIQGKRSSELAIRRSKNAERQRNYRKRLAQAKCNAEQQSNLMKIASGTIENKSTEQQTDSTVQMQQENTKKDAIQDIVPSELATQRSQNAKRQCNYRTRLSEEMLHDTCQSVKKLFADNKERLEWIQAELQGCLAKAPTEFSYEVNVNYQLCAEFSKTLTGERT